MTELFAFKLLTRDQWEQFRADGLFTGAPVDINDGYIHLSARDQVAETAAKHFAGQDDLMLLMIDLSALSDTVKWEPSRGGALFPHIYGTIPMSAVTTKAKIRLGDDGRHIFPAGF
tara:strand:- start:206 stop:553 length:348 start_codon:yes stop_codon:yes gene_type:complete